MSFFDFSKNSIYLQGPSVQLPARLITNEDLIEMMELKLKPTWIEKRTGIQSRYWANESESCSDLAIGAAKKLLNQTSLTREDIGLLCLATISGDYPSPPTSPLIQHALALDYNVGCFDLGAACSGFVTGLLNSAMIKQTLAKDILFITSDIRSKFLNMNDFQTGILFGDGAAACRITCDIQHADYRLLGGEMLSDGSVADIISIPVGGSREPVTIENFNENKLIMRSGSELFIKATNGMYESSLNLLSSMNLTIDDIKWIVPHQANLHMIHLIAQRLDFPIERISQTIKKWGNTSGASVGMALSELKEATELKTKDKILLISAGGGGLTANALLEVV